MFNTKSICLVGRPIHRSFSVTPELKCCIFCHMAAGTYFLGKVRARLSSHLVKTYLLVAVEALGR